MVNLYSIRIKEIWGYLKTQDALFWLINLYLFFEYVRPQTLYPSIDVLPFSKIILVFSFILFFLKGNSGIVKNPVNTLILFFFLVILLSSMSALSSRIAYDYVSDFLAWMVIYFLIINIVNTENRFLVFMLAFLLYSFKMSQYSFLNWAIHGFGFHKDGSGGGPGWFKNSGEFGIQMCVFLPLAFCFVYSLKDNLSKWRKCFFYLFPFTALTGAISCSSRGALVGASAVVVFMFLKTKHKFKGIFALIIVVVLVYSLLPENQLQRFKSSGEDTTSASRLQLWGRGIELVQRYPYLGVGYKNWAVAQKEIYGIDSQLLPHNIFIECASELGSFGLLFFCLMIVYTFVNNHQTRKLLLQQKCGAPFLFFMAHGLDGALIGYLVSGFFVTVLYYPYFWINLSMTVALNAIVRRNSTIDTVLIHNDL